MSLQLLNLGADPSTDPVQLPGGDLVLRIPVRRVVEPLPQPLDLQGRVGSLMVTRLVSKRLVCNEKTPVPTTQPT